MFQKFIFFIPEIIIFILSILLIIYGFLNIKISPAPKNINNLLSNINQIYCIEVPKLNERDNNKVIETINNAYRLMVISILSGFLLFLLSIYMFIIKIKNPLKIQNY